MPGAVIDVIILNVSRDENPQRVNKMASPSFEGFYTQLDCKPMYGNKNETQPALVWCITFAFKNKTEQNRNDDKYSRPTVKQRD